MSSIISRTVVRFIFPHILQVSHSATYLALQFRRKNNNNNNKTCVSVREFCGMDVYRGKREPPAQQLIPFILFIVECQEMEL